MKIRSGFVSNSSSSSFTCDVCGRTESGYDIGLSEFEMMECENGHVFCCCEALKQPSDMTTDEKRNYLISSEESCTWRKPEDVKNEVNKILGWTDEEVIDNFDDSEASRGYEVPKEICPICQMKETKDSEAFDYLMKIDYITRKALDEKIRNQFPTYNDFQDFLKKD